MNAREKKEAAKLLAEIEGWTGKYDPECAHSDCDEHILKFLRSLGGDAAKAADAFDNIERWYA